MSHSPLSFVLPTSPSISGEKKVLKCRFSLAKKVRHILSLAIQFYQSIVSIRSNLLAPHVNLTATREATRLCKLMYFYTWPAILFYQTKGREENRKRRKDQKAVIDCWPPLRDCKSPRTSLSVLISLSCLLEGASRWVESGLPVRWKPLELLCHYRGSNQSSGKGDPYCLKLLTSELIGVCKSEVLTLFKHALKWHPNYPVLSTLHVATS